MDSQIITTLFTFLYESPPAVQTVELLGSWDNFSKPYKMSRDTRRGRNHWAGCFHFEEIICDGHGDMLPERRSGGLKMGGRYWFYYKLNGDAETVDRSTPSTTTCPLLPGQKVNVLDVPVDSPPFISEQSSYPFPNNTPTHTMNPNDRFVKPRPAPSPLRPAARRLPPLNTTNITLAKYPGRPGMIYPISACDLTHPASAHQAVPRSPIPAFRERRAKSANGFSPALRSAFYHLKGSRSPPTEQQERGRARSQSEAKVVKIGSPVPVNLADQGRSSSSYPTASSPVMSSSPREKQRSPLSAQSTPFSPLRCHPITAEDELAVAQSKLESARASIEEIRARQRNPSRTSSSSTQKSIGAKSQTPSPIQVPAQMEWNEPPSQSRPSSLVLSRSREPSPLRKSLTPEDDMHPPVVDVPEEIQEVEDEGEHGSGLPMMTKSEPQLPAPDKSVKREMEAKHRAQSLPQPDLDKDLPDLPSWQPSLNSDRSEQNNWSDGLQNEPRSHFSVWSKDTTTEDLDEDPTISPSSPSSPLSPTYSSTVTSSSYNTPYRLSMLSDYDESDSRPYPLSLDTDNAKSTLTITQLSPDPYNRRQGVLLDSPGNLTYALPTPEEDGDGKQLGLEDYKIDPEPARLKTMEQLANEFAYLGERF